MGKRPRIRTNKDDRAAKRDAASAPRPYTDQQIQEARHNYLGKDVSVTHNGFAYTGNLYFLGYNEYLPSWGMCATVNRTPLQHVRIENISLLDINHPKHRRNKS